VGESFADFCQHGGMGVQDKYRQDLNGDWHSGSSFSRFLVSAKEESGLGGQSKVARPQVHFVPAKAGTQSAFEGPAWRAETILDSRFRGSDEVPFSEMVHQWSPIYQ
jgi:hypothetical protein